MRDLYAKAERGELDLDKTTERTAAALVQRYPSPPRACACARARAVVRVRCSRPTHRDNKGPGFNPSNKMLGDLVTAGFEQALVLQCMYRLFEKGYVADLTCPLHALSKQTRHTPGSPACMCVSCRVACAGAGATTTAWVW